MPTRDDVLAARCGLVVAPAGCGKTHLLCDAVAGHRGRPALVLTHTHAGVAALRLRLRAKGVPSCLFHLGTLDGLALRLVRSFPERAGLRVNLEADLGPQYDPIRKAAAGLLNSGAIRSLIPASYGRVLIDEYQDCTDPQHGLALALANHMPVCIFADPLQGVFDFTPGGLPNWDEKIRPHFELVGELDAPWRWINARAEGFGKWLQEARRALQECGPIDLATGEPWVHWRQLTGDESENRKNRLEACWALFPQGALLAIGDSRNPAGHREFARQCGGLEVVEPADLPDLIKFSRRAEGAGSGGDLLEAVLDFAADVMTGIHREAFTNRARALLRGTNRNPGSEVEQQAVAVVEGGGLGAARDLLRALRAEAGARVFRSALLNAALSSIDRATAANCDLPTAAVAVREGLRHRGRTLPRRAIGSTLLLKGLESDHAVILDADQMHARHLYVALTRASKSVTVFSRQPALNPRP